MFEWLETKHDQRFFLWVHYYDPHRPYNPPAPFAGKYRSEPELAAYLEERVFAPASGNGLATDFVNNRYDGEVRYVDEQIGKLPWGWWKTSNPAAIPENLLSGAALTKAAV